LGYWNHYAGTFLKILRGSKSLFIPRLLSY
jgi:hypothetical protein